MISILENYYKLFREHSLIDYAIEYNAINIFKYLIMNNANFTKMSCLYSICNQNYEVIHHVELKKQEIFKKGALSFAILSWNNDIVKYEIDNYGFDFIENKNLDSEKNHEILEIIKNFCNSINF